MSSISPRVQQDLSVATGSDHDSAVIVQMPDQAIFWQFSLERAFSGLAGTASMVVILTQPLPTQESQC
ncbi:amt family ammonium transporter [Fusarium oxysporum f. sp. vasinfectum 25433]|uniref:Amt family ammonium transporter n=1 Tax=Fusarium oxysporum f. sp. vasinfectum 25433 TaxID=1089449 RepID=X0LXR9_FUSOX|nr:amt family ammonium transporter [Fusarium oxysporum f. sp. vasinfectum 25433]